MAKQNPFFVRLKLMHLSLKEVVRKTSIFGISLSLEGEGDLRG